jgi:hypothetical protein
MVEKKLRDFDERKNIKVWQFFASVEKRKFDKEARADNFAAQTLDQFCGC